MGQTPEMRRPLVMAASLYFFDMVALTFMGSFLPLFINGEFGVSLVEATFWTGVALLFKQLSYAVGAPIWGWLSDRVGSTKMLIRVVVGHSIAHFLMFFSRDIYQFTAFLCVDAALGAISTPIFALLARTMKPGELPRAISYVQSAATVGGLLGPAIGGTLSYYFGYRPTYLVASLIFVGLVPVVILLRGEKSSRSIEKVEATANGKVVSYLRFIDLDFVGLALTYASMAFINPIAPLFLRTLGIVGNDQLLYYTTLLATLSSTFYVISNLMGTRYVRRGFLPILASAAMLMAIGQCFPINIPVFFALAIGIRAIQAPIQTNLFGGGAKRRSGIQIGVLNSGQYIGSAIGPFIASTVATTISLTAAFISAAAILSVASVFLFLRNRSERANHNATQND